VDALEASIWAVAGMRDHSRRGAPRRERRGRRRHYAAIAGQESITLNKNGDGYTGTFTIDQYDTNGNLIVELKGNQTATRITVDTTIDQML
jgi:hypothetical protein